MVHLFGRHLLTRKGIAVGVGVIFALSSFPGIAIACEGASKEAPVFPLGPMATETGSLGAVEPGEEKEFKISNQAKEEVEIDAWSSFNETPPMKLEITATTVNAPRCTPKVKLAAGAQCWYKVINSATEKGGVGKAKVQALGAKTWFTEIEAF
jgi:hypothetical protein